MNYHLNQTGRTHRQMTNAISLALLGIRVIYVVETKDMTRHAIKRLEALVKDYHAPLTPIKIMGMTEIGDFNWETMRPQAQRDPRPGEVYMVDHSVAEAAYYDMAVKISRLTRLQQQIYPMTTGDAVIHGVAEWGPPQNERVGRSQPARCNAMQQSDQMVCAPCNLAWDMNDPAPPACPRQQVKG